VKYFILIVFFLGGCAGNKTYLSMQEIFATRLAAAEKIESVEKNISVKAEKQKVNPAAEQLLAKAQTSLAKGDYTEALSFATAAEKKIDEPFDKSKIAEIKEAQKKEPEQTAAVPAAVVYKFYTVKNWRKSKDCLWNISKKFYGTGFKWRLIYFANMKQIKNPDMIKKGMILKIPMEKNI